ncbi:Mrp/NBP35 family ATP-binding protein [Timonella senegalensis]|uniref:Mrp/NBP35 family ATP-binding protein n=1 Tax=Timonella senegalensis TaxID=1465825 RepID=UPI0028A778B2|nr:P-loop NTPase [Timonella senegalensis]
MPTTPANVDVLRQGLDSALATVIDPEIRRPITELKMVRSIEIQESEAGTTALIGIDLTTPSCPMKGDIVNLVTQAAESVPGVDNVRIELGSMNAQQREELRVMLRGSATPVIPFTQPGNLTKIYAIGSGKGGVGKSTVTANLAAAMAKNGVKVGVLDADIYGFSIPRMLGVEGQPTRVDSMLLPPISHEVKVVSIGMFVPPGQPVVWRGPMLHRALEQFLTDVYWGDLDVLLLDLPPGTGDIAISVAQLLPNSSILTVTTPQVAAAEVAERSGSIALQTGQKLAGVVENMAWLEQPDGSKLEIFGSGGGEAVSASLSKMTGTDVPLIGQIPLDIDLRADGDAGVPVVLAHPDSPAAKALTEIALSLAHSERGLSGLRLNITPL